MKRNILSAAFLGGFGSLVYELVWTRYLALILGSSAYAVGVVTACYMAGLALGGFLLGRLTDGREKLGRLLSFGGFGLLCALSPLVFRAVRAAALVLGTQNLMLRVLLASLALLVPTAAIGGMTPVLMQAYRREKDSALVYGFFTLGSLFGALLTGFWLIPTLGLSGCGILGGLASLLALICLWNLPQGAAAVRIVESDAPWPPKVRRYAVLLYTVSGFTAMAYEMYQTKLLTLFFMDSVYDFTLILAMFLGGLFLGNCLGDRLAARRRRELYGLAVGQALLGLACLLSLLVLDRMPVWTDGMASAAQAGSFMGSLAVKTGCAALAVLPPALLWGSVFPLVSRLYLRGRDGVGAKTGVLTGWNTVGSALGSLLGSFVLIERLGLRGSILLGAGLNVLLALGCVLFLPKKEKIPVCVLGAAALVLAVLLPPWNTFEMSTSFLKPGQDVTGAVDMLYYWEDAYGVTSVAHFLPYDEKYLTTNRLYCQSTADLGGPEDHRRLGYIPMLLHGDPRDVLVTGLGSGVTLRGVVEYGQGQIDCVEISRAVVEAAACFREENGGAAEAENVTMLVEDARNYVARTDKQYDVVIGDIFFPMSSGSSSLFSREYYESILAHLKDGGLMVQWLPIHQFTRSELELTANTFAHVFPECCYFLGMIGDSVPAVGLVGSREPLQRDLAALEAVYSENPVLAQALGETALDDPYMLLSHYIGTIKPTDGPIVTDDKPILEYQNPAETLSYADRGAENLAWLLSQKAPSKEIAVCSEADRAILDEYDRMLAEFILGYVLAE